MYLNGGTQGVTLVRCGRSPAPNHTIVEASSTGRIVQNAQVKWSQASKLKKGNTFREDAAQMKSIMWKGNVDSRLQDMSAAIMSWSDSAWRRKRSPYIMNRRAQKIY